MGQYTYSSDNGNIKVKNAVSRFDKRTGEIMFMMDLKIGDNTSSDTLVVDIRSSGGEELANQAGVSVALHSGIWHSVKYTHNLGEDETTAPTWALKDYGTQVFSVIVAENATHASGDYVQLDFNVIVDLDPVEYHLTYKNLAFGDDSTPDILWTLSDLPQETFMNVPTLTVTSSGATANTLTVYLDDGDDTTTAVVIGTGGIVNMNGIAMGDSSVAFTTDNSHPGNKTYFKRIDSYKLTSPTLAEGGNDFNIDLKCEVI